MSEAPDGNSDLGRRAAAGGMTLMAGQLARILVQMVSLIILARLLTPHDYGLVAMVMAVVLVADIFRDLGLSAAAIRSPELTRGQQDNLFWVNAAVGVLLAGAAVLAGPVIARIYHEPALTDLTAVLALTFVLNGIATQFRADLNRRLRFSRLVTADLVAPVVALAVAAVLASHGAGPWALVVQQIVSAGVMTVLVVGFAGWLPRLPRRGATIVGFLRFGRTLVLSQVIGYVANNADSFMIGTRLGATQLGLYNRAFQLLMNPLNQLRGPLTNVALPVLSRLRDDPRRSQRFVEQGQLALGYTLGAGLGLVAGAAVPVCAVVLGPQWQVGTVFAFLAVAGVFQTLAFVGYWVYLSEALTGALLRFSMVSALIKIACIVVGSRWGLTGVAVGYALAPALSWPLSLAWLSRQANVAVRPLYAGASRILAVTTATGMASHAVAQWSAGLAPLVSVLLCCWGWLGAYALVVAVIAPVRRDVRCLVGVVRRVAGGARVSAPHDEVRVLASGPRRGA